MLRKFGLLIGLALACGHAQPANFNCTGAGTAPNTCTAVSDASAVAVATCKVYKGGVVYATAATVANACATPLPNTVGATIVTATFLDAVGNESPQSAPLAFNSLQPLAAPANLRITNP